MSGSSASVYDSRSDCRAQPGRGQARPAVSKERRFQQTCALCFSSPLLADCMLTLRKASAYNGASFGAWDMTKTAQVLLFCLVSMPASSRCLAQSDDLALKSQRAKELMAEGRFAEAIPIYRELNHAVPNNPGLMLNLGMALHMAVPRGCPPASGPDAGWYRRAQDGPALTAGSPGRAGDARGHFAFARSR